MSDHLLLANEVVARVLVYESRFTVRNQDGICVDWTAASKQDNPGFVRYVADRQWIRGFLRGQSMPRMAV